MSFRTSVILGVMFIVLLAGLFALRANQPVERDLKPARAAGVDLERPLFEDPPGELVSVVCTKGSNKPWRFEKVSEEGDSAPNSWRMTEPMPCSVPGHMVDGIANRLKSLKYEVKYEAGGTDGLTLAEAGLEPPDLVVEMRDAEGLSYVVHVGKPASPNTTFVRLPDSSDIFVAKASLDGLLRKRVEEYREKLLFNFEPGDAKQLEIAVSDDGEDVLYRLVKDDRNDWQIESPFSADAQDGVVNEAVRTLSRLRATDWADATGDGADGRFGFAPAKLGITVTCEKRTEVEAADSGAEDDETASETEGVAPEVTVERREHQLLVGSRGPLGKDSEFFARLSGERAVATVAKTIVEKLTPDPEKWRNMDVCRADVASATRVTVESEGRSAIMEKADDGSWSFADSKLAVESSAVSELLRSVNAMTAVTFVDGADLSSAEFGFNPPVTQLVFTVPGQDQPIRLAIGNPTDPTGRRLYYVRYGESSSLAKVRSSDVAAVRRGPLHYADRTILQLAEEQIESIDLTRSNAITGEIETLALERRDGSWGLIISARAESMAADSTSVRALLDVLGDLRAVSVASSEGDPAEFGLDDPVIRVVATYNVESTGGDVDDHPAPQMVTLDFSERDRAFAKRSDRSTIYEVSNVQLDTFRADLHAKEIWPMDGGSVSAISVTAADNGATFRFARSADGWVYSQEPDLPLDGAKVENLVLQLLDMKHDSYVAYEVNDWARFGLDKPERIVTIESADGTRHALSFSAGPCLADRANHRCAIFEGSADVFLLSADMASRCQVSVDDFELAPDS